MEVKGARRSSERNHGKYFVPNRQRRISGSLWLAIDRGNWFEIRGAMECIGNQISCPPATSDVALRPPPTLALFLPPDRQWRVRQGESFPGILRMWRRPGMLGAAVVIVVVVVVVAVFSTTPIFPSPRDSQKFHDHDDSRVGECNQRPSDGTSNWVESLNGRAIRGDRDVEWDWDIISLSVKSLCLNAFWRSWVDAVVKEDNALPFVTARRGTEYGMVSHHDIISRMTCVKRMED